LQAPSINGAWMEGLGMFFFDMSQLKTTANMHQTVKSQLINHLKATNF